MEKRLELLFLTEEGKSSSLAITDPADGLTEETIRGAMEVIAAQDLIQVIGVNRYKDIRGARYVSRQVEEVFTTDNK